MKAILVSVSLMTRIIVEDDFDTEELKDQDYDTIRKLAYPRLVEQLYNDGVGDHLEEVFEDESMPFDQSDAIYGIIERKEKGIDNTEAESAEIKGWLRQLRMVSEQKTEAIIQSLFPQEYEEYLQEQDLKDGHVD